jgi:hypothetical protein
LNERLKADGKSVEFAVPERRFTSRKAKVEMEAYDPELGEAETVNKFLNNPEVSDETKRKVIESMGELFVHDFKHGPILERDVDGRTERFKLVRSDPSVGNMMVKVRDDGSVKLWVIDRNLYLKVDEAQTKLMEQLVLGNKRGFVGQLVDIALDKNKIRGVGGAAKKAAIVASLVKNFGVQNQHGETMDQLQFLSDKLESYGLSLDLDTRLLIKNCFSLQNLFGRFGMRLEDQVSFEG